MHSACSFPTKVAVSVRPADQEGLALSLCFESSRKNHFYYPVFVDCRGYAEVSGEELLRTFDEDRAMFIMDYDDPRLVFTGRVTAEVQGTSELEGAVSALGLFRGKCSFPEDYEQKLKFAAARGQEPDRYQVDVKIEYAE